ncbi:MAG: recombinase family protein [bacterium]|nr:recombinase family protein [bacterium]
MARAALYARVSTSDQHPEAQLDRLREWAGRTGMDTVEFVDRRSGRCTSREALDALLSAVRRHEIEVVACVKLDRLARSTRHLCDLADTFDAASVDLVCLDQSVDTRSAAGRLLYRVLGAVGEFEADLIRERTRDGMAAARKRGRRPGRPRVLDRKQQDRIHRLRTSGSSLRRIADLVGVSYGTVQRVISGGDSSEGRVG